MRLFIQFDSMQVTKVLNDTKSLLNKMPAQQEKNSSGGGQDPVRGGTSRGGTDLNRGGMTSGALCPPLN